MDLVALAPRDPASEEFHANWTGWGLLADLLVELGCDITEMSVTNEGEVVREVTAREWGLAILENMDRIVEVRYRDEMFQDGFRSEFKVVGSQTPVLLSRLEVTRAIVGVATVSDVMGLPPVDEVPEVRAVIEDDRARTWLERAALFFLNSGGFAQY